MLPHTHFLFPFAIGLTFLSWRLALLAGVVGVLIDLDHYVEHILHAKKNRFSVKDTWNNSIKLHKFEQRSFIHHWQGIVIISILLLILAFFNLPYTYAIGLGYFSHLALDYLFHKKGDVKYEIKIRKYFFKISKTELWIDVVLVIALVYLLA